MPDPKRTFKVIRPNFDDPTKSTAYEVDAGDEDEAEALVDKHLLTQKLAPQPPSTFGPARPGQSTPAKPGETGFGVKPAMSPQEENGINQMFRRAAMYGTAALPGLVSRSPLGVAMGLAGAGAKDFLSDEPPPVFSSDNVANVADAALSFVPGGKALGPASRSALQAMTASTLGEAAEGRLPGVETGAAGILGALGGAYTGNLKEKVRSTPTLATEDAQRQLAPLAEPFTSKQDLTLRNAISQLRTLRPGIQQLAAADDAEFEKILATVGKNRTTDRMQAEGALNRAKKTRLELITMNEKGVEDLKTTFRDSEMMRRFFGDRVTEYGEKLAAARLNADTLSQKLASVSGGNPQAMQGSPLMAQLSDAQEEVRRLERVRKAAEDEMKSAIGSRDAAAANLKTGEFDFDFKMEAEKAAEEVRKAQENARTLRTQTRRYNEMLRKGEISQVARDEYIDKLYKQTGFNVKNMDAETRSTIMTLFKDETNARSLASKLVADSDGATDKIAAFGRIFGRNSDEIKSLRSAIMDKLTTDALSDEGKYLSAKKFGQLVNKIHPETAKELFDNPKAYETLKGVQAMLDYTNRKFTGTGADKFGISISSVGTGAGVAASIYAGSPIFGRSPESFAGLLVASAPILLSARIGKIAQASLEKGSPLGRFFRDFATRPNEGTATRVLSYILATSDLSRDLREADRPGTKRMNFSPEQIGGPTQVETPTYPAPAEQAPPVPPQ